MPILLEHFGTLPQRVFGSIFLSLIFSGCLFDPDPGSVSRPRTTFDFTLLQNAPNPLLRWVSVPAGKDVMGVKFAFKSLDYKAEVDSNMAAFTTESGHVPATIGAYFDISAQPQYLQTFLDAVNAHGVIPFVTLDPKIWSDTNATYEHSLVSLILNGNFDSEFKSLAQTLKSYGKPVLFRYAHEMNGNWYPYSGAFIGAGGDTDRDGQPDGPENYIKAWRHAHDLFIAEGATNLVWIFCPNSEDFPAADWNRPFQYYPGSAYVDMISVDGYESPDKKRQSLSTAISEFYNELGLYFDSHSGAGYEIRPFGLSEFGTYRTDSADKAAWYAEALRYIAGDGRIQVSILYNDRNNAEDFSIKGLGPVLKPFFDNPRFFY